MYSIWKYPLLTIDRQYLLLPKSSEILTIQMQKDVPTLWAIVEIDKPKSSIPLERRTIVILGTGMTFDKKGSYIGTYQIDNGNYVFHVFEEK